MSPVPTYVWCEFAALPSRRVSNENLASKTPTPEASNLPLQEPQSSTR